MKVIEEEPYFYSLESDSESYFLEVVCGTSATWMVKLQLSVAEIARAKSEENFVRVLAQQIAYEPERFNSRYI